MAAVTPGDDSFNKQWQTDCGLHVWQLQWVVSFVGDVGRIDPADESVVFSEPVIVFCGCSGV